MIGQKKYKRALVLGAGSGRDMASAVLMVEGLRKKGMEVDLAGFLTPWALHSFDGRMEGPVNRLVLGQKAKKCVVASGKEAPFFEPELLELNQELHIGIRDMYVFSLQCGTRVLKGEMERMIAQNGYGLVLAVDVGGDILARRKDFPSLLTPIVDFSCLQVLTKIKSGADMRLAVVAPGVDGEIPLQAMREIFAEFERNVVKMDSEQIEKESEEYRKFVAVNEEINRRTGTGSHTFEVIKKAMDAAADFAEEFVSKTKRFSAEIAIDLAQKIFHFDLRQVAEQRRDREIEYETIPEAAAKLKGMGVCETEADRF